VDGDGKKDIKMGGDHGWLYLTADTSSIGDWVDGGPHPQSSLQPHVWLSGNSGNVTSVYIKMKNQNPKYRIIAFAPFYVSCVDKKGDCPGMIYAQSLDEDIGKGPVIEGFFLSNYSVSIDINQVCDINLGNCLISLSD